MDFEVNFAKLKEKIKDSKVLFSDVEELFDPESDEYKEATKRLNDEGIEIVDFIDEDAEPSEEQIEDLNLEDLPDVDISKFDALPPSIKVDDPVRMYLKEIGTIELLNAEEEQKYANIVVEGQKAQQKIEEYTDDETYADGVNEYYDVKEEFEFDSEEKQARIEDIIAEYPYMKEFIEADLAVEAGENAKNKLVEANLRLVVSIAKRYIGRGLQFLDLIQEGNMGLMKAVDKYEPDKGFKFSTYATWWIRQAITRAVADQARTIRIPVHMVETINKLVRVQRQLVQKLSREPSPEEVAKEMGISVEKVQNIQKIAQEPISLEQPVGEEEDSSLGDFVPDNNALDPYEYTAKAKLREELDAVLATLTEREERVLRLRFGLLDGRPRTLEEVGKEFGVTRERIRQIESKALRKLKHPSKSRKLKDFLVSK